MVAVHLVCTAGLVPTVQSCADSLEKSKESHTPVVEVVERIVKEAGVKSERFFLISADVCLECLDEKVENIYGKRGKYLDFIMVGGDSSHIKVLNAIYGRKQLKFSLCSKMLWDQLVKIDKKFSMGVFLGVKRGPDGSRMFYDGFDIPAPERVNAVLRFCRE
jgi:hypothetical protein